MDSMNTAATQPALAGPPRPGIEPRDRLGFTLFLAAVLHALVILGITFDVPDPRELARSLEITLATQPSTEAPDDADYLAKFDQLGSGTLDEKATPSTPEETVFQDSEIQPVIPVEEAAPPPEPTQQQVVTTRAPAPERVTSAPVQPEPRDASQAGIRFDLSQLSGNCQPRGTACRGAPAVCRAAPGAPTQLRLDPPGSGGLLHGLLASQDRAHRQPELPGRGAQSGHLRQPGAARGHSP